MQADKCQAQRQPAHAAWAACTVSVQACLHIATFIPNAANLLSAEGRNGDFAVILDCCGADFQSAFQSYVDGNGTDNITPRVPPGNCNVSSDLHPGVVTADAADLPRQQENLSASRFSDASEQQCNTAKLNRSSQILRCSSSTSPSHSLVSICSC